MKVNKPDNERSLTGTLEQWLGVCSLPLTLTLEQCLDVFRFHGIAMDKKRLADGIAGGFYPGRVISVGCTGRRNFEIWTKDILAFLAERTPCSTPPQTVIT